MKIISIKPLGVKPTYSIEMTSPFHNYKIGNIISANSHSKSYAMIAYQTAYLKKHYPVEYMSALLSSVKSDKDKTQLYMVESNNIGVKILPPCINKSGVDFTPDGDDIRFGLGSIKNVGEAALKNIIEERERGQFKSFYDFCSRVDRKALNSRVVESMVKSGVFSTLEISRKKLYLNIESILKSFSKKNVSKTNGQISLLSSLSDKDKTNLYTLKGSDEEFLDIEIQQFEKELLGFYITSHPLDGIRKQIPFHCTHTVSELTELNDGDAVVLCGLLTGLELKLSKSNRYFKTGRLEDITGDVKIMAFSDVLEKYNPFLQDGMKATIAGRVQKKVDGEEIELSVIVESTKLINEVKILDITLKESATREDIEHLKNILANYKGNEPLIIHSSNSDSVLTSQNNWICSKKINIDDISFDFINSIGFNHI